jgi:hypothetical protein
LVGGVAAAAGPTTGSLHVKTLLLFGSEYLYEYFTQLPHDNLVKSTLGLVVVMLGIVTPEAIYKQLGFY